MTLLTCVSGYVRDFVYSELVCTQVHMYMRILHLLIVGVWFFCTVYFATMDVSHGILSGCSRVSIQLSTLFAAERLGRK